MKAVCVTTMRSLEVREVATPGNPPSGHVLVAVEAAGINHGDKAFLARPMATTGLNTSRDDIWGASAAGTVVASGPEVPAEFAGRRVAMYRSLTASAATVGLWSEYAVVPWTSCVVLPEGLAAVDYCGSLVNAMTAYAFLEEMTAEGHAGVIVTAGGSATGLALAALARERGIPAIFLVRSERAREELRGLGIEHVCATSSEGFEAELAGLAERLKTTAVFDGVGGEIIGRIAPHLPMASTVWFYGFLAGAAPVSVPSGVFLMKKLTMTGFSNFNSRTVQDRQRLIAGLGYLQGVIGDPLFRTRVGRSFGLEEIAEAMAYEATPGAKAVLVPTPA